MYNCSATLANRKGASNRSKKFAVLHATWTTAAGRIKKTVEPLTSSSTVRIKSERSPAPCCGQRVLHCLDRYGLTAWPFGETNGNVLFNNTLFPTRPHRRHTPYGASGLIETIEHLTARELLACGYLPTIPFNQPQRECSLPWLLLQLSRLHLGPSHLDIIRLSRGRAR